MDEWRLLPLHPDDQRALQDIPASESHVKHDIIAGIKKLKTDPFAGFPLKPLKEHQVFSRSLEDCMVLYVADYDYGNSWRVVYRVHEDEHTIEIVAVGKRMGSEVYKTAMKRLAPAVPKWAKYAKGRR